MLRSHVATKARLRRSTIVLCKLHMTIVAPLDVKRKRWRLDTQGFSTNKIKKKRLLGLVSQTGTNLGNPALYKVATDGAPKAFVAQCSFHVSRFSRYSFTKRRL